MKHTRLLLPTLAIAMLAGSGSAFAQNYYGHGRDNGSAYGQQWRGEGGGQWVEQRGFQDGAFGADRDFQNHRRPDVNNRDEYREPRNIPGWAMRNYREAFRRGYYNRVREVYRSGYGYR